MGFLKLFGITILSTLLGTQSFANLICENDFNDQLIRIVGPPNYFVSSTDNVSLSVRNPKQWTYTITTDIGAQELKVQTRDKKVQVVLQNQNVTTLPNYYPYLYSALVKVDYRTSAKVLVQVIPGTQKIQEIYVEIYDRQ